MKVTPRFGVNRELATQNLDRILGFTKDVLDNWDAEKAKQTKAGNSFNVNWNLLDPLARASQSALDIRA